MAPPRPAELTAGREAKGYKRLAPEQRAKVIEVRNAKPEATQAEVAREAGVSRPTVSRLAPGRRRKGARTSPAGR
jgi:transcriptional regulator with XRE-family HTH domain